MKTIDDYVTEWCNELRFDKDKLLTNERVREVHSINLKKLCYLYLFKLKFSYREIGDYFKRDKTSIQKMVRKLPEQIKFDRTLREDLKPITDVMEKSLPETEVEKEVIVDPLMAIYELANKNTYEDFVYKLIKSKNPTF